MTGFEISRLDFRAEAVRDWAASNALRTNWPVVYVLDGRSDEARSSEVEVYVGETLNAQARLRQHLESRTKSAMRSVRVIVDEEFNKSAALDLESFLIRHFAGDGHFRVANRNDGVVDAAYFDRAKYQESFEAIFEALRAEGLFTRDIAAIENDDLFKLSPFKALTAEQTEAVEGIMRVVAERLLTQEDCTVVVRGAPGTGKTIVGVFLMKLIADLGAGDAVDQNAENESPLSSLFSSEDRVAYTGLDVGFVIPQQSLRRSVQEVFRRTRGLSASQVMSPFTAAEHTGTFDVLLVDEAHRLNRRASQPSGPLNKQFGEINQKLFGEDDFTKTQLDWVTAKSRIRILLLDERQSVMPADLPRDDVMAVVAQAQREDSYFELQTQMRVRGGRDYVEHVRGLLDVSTPMSTLEARSRIRATDYEIRFFDDIRALHDAIRARDREYGLSRLVAGYAWEWKSKNDASAMDIEIDGYGLQWNRTAVDWITSAGAIDQVGSIHTVQGYDLNYAGVIIGNDLKMDPTTGRLVGVRESYFDKRGKQNNRLLGIEYSDDDLGRYIADIYGVLLTRGVRGTYLYVSDPGLREYLQRTL
ncbi:DUF2075 domain-containing protein [Amnibacterium kyonggiense]|uniref:GIY-YIG domain-containing protein n=1 Tax=Amnibacterium kyonggiense TaxID=595671 RepID=A0A4R7FLJ9_9MICO|nr:DUF2075 domain-containing protein [Amnibacterium kyonggiense]TDS77249.1 hypothetical protein CLV52_2190 [Amnibacterium kyonggiense]